MLYAMEFFIHTLCSGNTSNLAHLQFEKYSRGTFANKAVVQCKVSKGAYSVATTSEYANEFVRMLGEELGSAKTTVEGVIVSTKPLPAAITHGDISQFMGVKKYAIKGEFSGHDLVTLCDTVPRAFIALSFHTPTTELKIKPKAPKSAKPGNSSADGLKVDFCKLKTTNKAIIDKLFFDAPTFKQAEANHTFVIESIEVPKDETDPIKMRERAVRKGTIVRKLTVDGIKHEKNYAFSA